MDKARARRIAQRIKRGKSYNVRYQFDQSVSEGPVPLNNITQHSAGASLKEETARAAPKKKRSQKE